MRKVVYIALFTAFVWVAGIFRIPLPGISVPLVLQNLAAILTGAVLGPIGSVSIILWLLLGIMGFPVFSGGTGGIGVFLGPTGGYLIGYLVASFVVGLLIKQSWVRLRFSTSVIICIFGMLLIYLVGIPILMYRLDMEIVPAIKTNLIFIPFDIAKAILAAYITILFKKHYPIIKDITIKDDTRE